MPLAPEAALDPRLSDFVIALAALVVLYFATLHATRLIVTDLDLGLIDLEFVRLGLPVVIMFAERIIEDGWEVRKGIWPDRWEFRQRDLAAVPRSGGALRPRC